MESTVQNTIQNKEGQGRIFENVVLETLTKTSPVLTIVTYSSVVVLLLALNYIYQATSFFTGLLLYLGGLLFWSLFEYLMHRYVFHFASESKLARRFHYMIHGVHHQYPRDKERLFMPPVPGILIISVLFLLFYLILERYTFTFLAGLLNGYLLYTLIHYSVHMYRPPKYFKKLWVHHAMHHYRYHDKAYGVSSPLWDIVFGTMPPRDVKKVH